VYEHHFELRAKPFQLNPDPEFYFGSRGHKRAMAYLMYGLHQGEGFIVVTGEVGAGKTTLLRGLLGQIQADVVVPAEVVSTQVDSDDLLRLVAASFGVPNEGADKATLLIRLQAYFESLHADGRRALLIVDEAQNLTPRAVEELRMLSNFQVGPRSLVQSFLVGQPELRGIMQRPEMRQLRQRVIASYHLGPLDAGETREYIEHRLRHVGWQQNPRFEPEAFLRIHEATDGVPRRINVLCDRLLLGAYLSDAAVIGAGDVGNVAEEIETELGPATGGAHRAAEVRPLSSARAPDAAAPAPEPDEPGPPPGPAAGEQALRDEIARLEARVAALETSSNMMLSLMKRVLRSLQGTVSSGANRSSGG
jgi:general secretion pathway protein A